MPRYLDDVDPDFAEELQLLLGARGYARLATAVFDLKLFEARQSSVPEGASFYTVGRWSASRLWGYGSETRVLRVEPLLSVDVVGDRIVAVEVSERPRLRNALRPPSNVNEHEHEHEKGC